MRIKVKDLKGSGVPVRFGPISHPEKYEIDLLDVARGKLSLEMINDFNEVELEIGDRLGGIPYADTGRAKKPMPPTYLCEGSVWLNFYAPEGECANISLVPHMDTTGHKADMHPHHNFYTCWTDFDGYLGCDKNIPGHSIPKGEPVAISIICGEDVRKGTIDIRT